MKLAGRGCFEFSCALSGLAFYVISNPGLLAELRSHIVVIGECRLATKPRVARHPGLTYSAPSGLGGLDNSRQSMNPINAGSNVEIIEEDSRDSEQRCIGPIQRLKCQRAGQDDGF